MLRCRNCTATLAFLQCGSHLDQKLHCSKRKTALQHRKSCVAESGAFLLLSCGFEAPTFRYPRFGPAEIFTMSETRNDYHQRRNHPHHHFGQLTRTMVWVLSGRKLRPWSEFPFLYRFTVLLNSGGSNSPWSEFWSEFPHFMGMGVVPAPSRLHKKFTNNDFM